MVQIQAYFIQPTDVIFSIISCRVNRIEVTSTKIMAIYNNIIPITVLIIELLMWSGPVQCLYNIITHNNVTASQCSECLTLSHLSYLSYFNSYLTFSDETLIFEPGDHNLDLELRISNATSFSMIANTTSSSNHNVTIVCNKGGGFTFIGGHNIIHIKGLNFIGCVGNKLEYVDLFAIEESNFVGRKRDPTHSYVNGSILRVF